MVVYSGNCCADEDITQKVFEQRVNPIRRATGLFAYRHVNTAGMLNY